MAYRIRSKVEGFCRCGVRHSANWTPVRDGLFSPEQIETLKAEPMLQVEEFQPDLSLEGDKAEGSDMTKAQLAAKLMELGVELPKSANKATLQALLDDASAKPQDEKVEG